MSLGAAKRLAATVDVHSRLRPAVDSPRGPHVYLDVVGELGRANGPGFSEAVRTRVGAGERRLVVDLGQLTVLDLHGVSALEGARTLPSLHNGELVLESSRSGTLWLPELAGLANSFTVCDERGGEARGVHPLQRQPLKGLIDAI